MSFCSKCKIDKSDADFKKDKRRPNGLASYCKACHNLASRISRLKDPERIRAYYARRRKNNKACITEYMKRYRLKSLFGLSLEEFQAKLLRQQGLCRICSQPESIVDPRSGDLYDLSVDHNHMTKTVRDLLCRRCNRVFGNIGESPELAQSLLDYALRWAGK